VSDVEGCFEMVRTFTDQFCSLSPTLGEGATQIWVEMLVLDKLLPERLGDATD